MGQPTQRATKYTARSNIDTAQIFLHANGQRPKRAMIRQRSRRRQRRGEPHTEHGLEVLLDGKVSRGLTRAVSGDDYYSGYNPMAISNNPVPNDVPLASGSPCLRWWGRLCRRRCATGGCARGPGVGRCLSGVYNHHHHASATATRTRVKGALQLLSNRHM